MKNVEMTDVQKRYVMEWLRVRVTQMDARWRAGKVKPGVWGETTKTISEFNTRRRALRSLLEAQDPTFVEYLDKALDEMPEHIFSPEEWAINKIKEMGWQEPQ